MKYEQIKPEIIEEILNSDDKGQDTIDGIIWDIINQFDNKEELWEEILEDGAFGWLCEE
jgi:hypothetical protein